jgi:multiple sugar transport system substrate-binding protein
MKPGSLRLLGLKDKEMLKKKPLFGSLWVILTMILSACASTPAAVDTTAPTPSAAVKVEVKDFVTWYTYDQDNLDPASDEHVGNEYLRKTIPQFNEQFKDKWKWVNVYKAFDKLAAELVAADIAGGDVPDLIETDRNLTYAKNGTLQDLSAWASAQPWYKDLDPGAVATCTIAGKLFCIPAALRPNLTYVWKDRYPNGYPATPEQFLVEAERLKKEGKYAITFFGSTAFGGNAFRRGIWDIVSSFGGKYDDGRGNMLLTSPQTVAAITFLRDIVAKGYVPEVAFAGNFQEEDAFKDSSAGAFPTGLFGYRYLNPLTAPSGKKYEKKTTQDMFDAIAAGDILLKPSFAPAGNKPGCGILVDALGIPKAAKNPEAARDFINWIMGSADINAQYVINIGAGFPALKPVLSHPSFQTPFYKEAADAMAASACTPTEGSLTRVEEAKTIVTNVIYKLIKEDPSADILSELTKAQEEYNKNN